MRGRWRHRPNYEWVVPRTEDLAGQERPSPQTEVRPLPPAPSRPTPRLPPPLPELNTLPEVQNPPPVGGAPSGENGREEETTADARQEIPPVECNNPPVSTPPPSPVTTHLPTTISSPPTNLTQFPASAASTPRCIAQQ